MRIGCRLRLHDNIDLDAKSSGSRSLELVSEPLITEVEGVPVGPGAEVKRRFLNDCRSEFTTGMNQRGWNVQIVASDTLSSASSDTLLTEAQASRARQDLRRSFSAFKKSLGPLEVPRLPDLVLDPSSQEAHWKDGSAFQWRGGERAALQHLHQYVWVDKALTHYKATRNGLLLTSDSSKLSPWLAAGAISPRWIYQSVKAFEADFGASESTVAFIDELLWRDYFKWLRRDMGETFFQRKGLRSADKDWSADRMTFRSWALGETGVPFVDAGMRELWWTGWMSNRLRQNVASYLAKICGIDWTWGARWFEAHLIDHDTDSNWGNWLYLSGHGTDPRDRTFNPERQAEFYDPHGEYQQLWLARPARLT